MSRPTREPKDCPCGSEQTYAACCGVFHAGTVAPTAQALMRSRYSAYVLQLADYLLATWHTRTRPASLTFDTGTKWLGLSVQSARDLRADHAEVCFVARYRVNGGSAVRMNECSHFERVDGCWLYVSDAAAACE